MIQICQIESLYISQSVSFELSVQAFSFVSFRTCDWPSSGLQPRRYKKVQPCNSIESNPSESSNVHIIGHFGVHVCLLFKARLSAKFAYENYFSFIRVCKEELITITKTLHLDSL